MEPIGGDESVPEAQHGFEVKPLEDWTENGTDPLTQSGPDSVAGVDFEVDPLPISEGLNDQGQWKIGGSDSNPTGPVAMGSSTEAEQAFVELWSEGT
ncbi:MAG: hypothetical protein P1V35_09465, partial [Planctomycetota bacterium]|nr:hypothetical protein [Planctomycetota bacterium]